MSTTPWGAMNGRLSLETEQRGTWLQQRVQDLRAAQVARPAVGATERVIRVRVAAERQPPADRGCPRADRGCPQAEAA